MKSSSQKLLSALLLLAVIGSVFVSPFTVNKAGAGPIPGVPDPTVTVVDVPRWTDKVATFVKDVLLQRVKTQMLKMIQNDLVNWVQGGGRPRFLQNPLNFFADAGDRAVGQALYDVFQSKVGINVCSPFKTSVAVLVTAAAKQQKIDESVKCTLGDIKENLEDSMKLFRDSFKQGGWKTWIRLQEPQNTLAGSFLDTLSYTAKKTSDTSGAAQAEIDAGGGFLDQKACVKAVKQPSYTQRAGQASPEVFKKDLRKDYDGPTDRDFSRDPDIKKLQQVLSSFLGESIAEDGIFGPETESAVKEFQSAVGIPATGIVDAQTRQTLNEEADPNRQFAGFDVEQPVIDYSKQKHGGIMMDKLPQDERCIETVTVTPGQFIADQVSGGLEKLHIDKVLGSKELAQILNAVIDAAVNRVARQGLAYITSGRGSWSEPAPGNRGRDRQRRIDIQGLEGVRAAEFLNKVVGLKTSVEKTRGTMNKLTAGKNRVDGFIKKMDKIIKEIANTQGCRGGTDMAIDNCLWRTGPGGRFGYDFNIEDKNPGPYYANQALHQKTAELWSNPEDTTTEAKELGIAEALAALEADPRFNTCPAGKVPDVRYALDPDDDKLPFSSFNADGDTLVFQHSKNNISYLDQLLKPEADGGASRVPMKEEEGGINEFRSYLGAAASIASSESNRNREAAAAYDSLAENLARQSEALNTDLVFSQNLTPKAVLYASALMDYDRAGRGTYDTGKKQTVTKDGVEVEEPVLENIALISKVKTYQDSLSKGNEAEADLARAELLVAQKRTRVRWENDINATIDSNTADPGLKQKAQEKLPIIAAASSLIFNSLTAVAPEMLSWVEKQETAMADAEEILNLPAPSVSVSETDREKAQIQLNQIREHKDLIRETKKFFGQIPATETTETTGRDPNQIGLGVSIAVGQAMELDIEGITNELEQRDARVKQLQSEISGTLGQWEVDQTRRIELGYEGGDTEWEIFFKNRFQFAYVAYIHDFYVNQLSQQVDCNGDGVGDGAAIQQAAAARPKQAIAYSDFFDGFDPSDISIRVGTAVTFTFNKTRSGARLIFDPAKEWIEHGQSYLDGPGAVLDENGQTYTYIFNQKGSWTFHNFDRKDHAIEITVY